MIRCAKPSARAIAGSEEGATAIEFAILAPVLLVMIIGTMDLGLELYARSVVAGAMQEAGRDSALEPGGPTAAQMDAAVESQIHAIVPYAEVTFNRSNYKNYADVGVAEDFTDSNSDGVCNDGEPFQDMNGNGNWDADQGRDGRGGASDAVVYESETKYTRLLPVQKLIGYSPDVVIRSATVLRNQPYSNQSERIPEVGYCAT
ncbi:TadE/TadG family type IV pilus assembly protein [Erythrobacter ani]|uniref:Pilus assembly protein n=1 Tax=Erythrobacter ani TaxID=2827235 RepID=A0ABS6SMK3_9SPHN|nr:TadE/TadG family type IV pilus assembly protein [Erythrobacter ani]MBV7266275.1 pilus assembly protein [Erythrobacter ani]